MSLLITQQFDYNHYITKQQRIFLHSNICPIKLPWNNYTFYISFDSSHDTCSNKPPPNGATQKGIRSNHLLLQHKQQATPSFEPICTLEIQIQLYLEVR